jgi:hypothetical protein
LQLVTVAGFFIALSTISPAQADGGLFGQVLQGMQTVAAQAAWQKIEPAVQNCLQSQYDINPADLAAQGIGPNDPRVSPDIASCRQAIAQGQAPAQQQQQNAEDPAQREKELTALYGRKAAKQIVAGNIDIGMNQDEVQAAWGDPGDRQQGAHGQEKWVYGDDTVTFTHGKVSAVGH